MSFLFTELEQANKYLSNFIKVNFLKTNYSPLNTRVVGHVSRIVDGRSDSAHGRDRMRQDFVYFVPHAATHRQKMLGKFCVDWYRENGPNSIGLCVWIL